MSDENIVLNNEPEKDVSESLILENYKYEVIKVK